MVSDHFWADHTGGNRTPFAGDGLRRHQVLDGSFHLTNMQQQTHNRPVTRIKSVIGLGNPGRFRRRTDRLTFMRLSGFFVRANHLMGEACGRPCAGRFLLSGVSNPQRLAHHLGKWREAPVIIRRSFAMQAISSVRASAPTFTLPAAIRAASAGTLKPVTAQEHANTIITDVKCILTASIDILSSPSGLSTESTLAINLEVAAGLLETAETLMSLAEGE